MRYYLTRSYWVQLVTGQDCGHFAAEFGQGDNAVVVESTMINGVRPQWRKAFLKTHKVVHCLERVLPMEKEIEIYDRVVNALNGKTYDYQGAFGLGLISLIQRTGVAFKPSNVMGKASAAFCTEILAAQKDWLSRIGFDVSALENQRLLPHDAFIMLKNTGKYVEVNP